ncbi:MAG: FdhF/YdeP family oxidoreductase [Deltaproteobacteria bacterium]|nr:MAG: FdhF/YdeP family oxidoreductase [Deltaproteobacteria bacterium]
MGEKTLALEKPQPVELADPRGSQAQPPSDPIPVSRGKPSAVAAGIPAIVETIKHAFGKAGPLRGARLLYRLNQVGGYDCPSCAWPDPDGERSFFEFCENGAKAAADEGTARRAGPDFFARFSLAELSERSDYWLGKQGRLTEPMVLRPGDTHYQPLCWDEAFALLGSELNALDSPNEAVFYTSGRASNEAAFLYQLFAREYGTNNLPDCSNMCHESSGSGLSETIGEVKGTVTLDDFEKAQLIVVVGQNPGTNHPRMLTALQKAKRGGAAILSVNPLRETGLLAFRHPQQLLTAPTQLTDLFLQVRINGDVALFQGIGKAILETDGVDEAFVRGRCENFLAYADHLRSVSWDEIALDSGIRETQIRAAARMFAGNERIIVCWAMGLTQHENAVDNIREIVNVLLLRGAIGKPGAGVCPVRGHSNVQGDRTMGIWERPTPAFVAALEKATGITAPRAHGFDTVNSIHALHEGKAKVFLALGGNFLSATPDTEYTAAALRSARLTAHVSTKLNRSHLVAGRTALILPCLGRSERDEQAGREQFVTTENSMGVIQMSQGHLRPASEHLLSEPQIVARLAQAALGARSKVRWAWLTEDYDRIRDLIAQVVPGTEGYNDRARKPGGFYLPNAAREGRFQTASGKARFTVHPLPSRELRPGQLLMMTVRSHDQFNTTIYGLEDRYRGLSGDRRVVLLNREDMSALGLREGQRVDLTSHFRGETRTARRFQVVGYDLPRGCACTYFPEANALVPSRQVARISNTPASKSVVITVAPARDDAPLDPERTPESQCRSR